MEHPLGPTGNRNTTAPDGCLESVQARCSPAWQPVPPASRCGGTWIVMDWQIVGCQKLGFGRHLGRQCNCCPWCLSVRSGEAARQPGSRQPACPPVLLLSCLTRVALDRCRWPHACACRFRLHRRGLVRRPDRPPRRTPPDGTPSRRSKAASPKRPRGLWDPMLATFHACTTTLVRPP